MTFVNRVDELAEIERILHSRRSEMIIVYGRRGVGKSALLVEALGSRNSLFYQATTRTMPQQLEDLTSALRSFAPDAILPGVLPSFDAMLRAISQLARSRAADPLIVVIDELPYLAQADPSVPTVLQKWWDDMRRQGILNLKVFLLGSLISWMESQTLSEHGPLHNRRTGQIRLDPLDYRAATLFYPSYAPHERIAAYAIWGGLPSYLEEIDPSDALWTNVRDRILQPATRLADEPSWLRFGDLRNDALYSSILRAVAVGNHRPSTIARAVGKSRADEVAYQLERLTERRLVRRVVPVHHIRHTRSTQALYILADHFVGFWYRFVDPLRHLLNLGRYDEALSRIQEEFDPYVGSDVFEDVCHQFLWRALADGRLPTGLTFDTLGSWWVARTDTQDQVDVVAMDRGHAVLLGKCKWTRQPVGSRELHGLDASLHKSASDLEPVGAPFRALFSRSGFSDDLLGLARDPSQRLLLFTPEDLWT